MNAVVSGTYALPCGCVCLSEGDRYVTMCKPHDTEWRTRHTQALADHRARMDKLNTTGSDT